MKKAMTLADFSVPLPLFCMHCSCRLRPSSPVELYANYAVILCPKCNCMSPFQLEKSA